MLSILAAGSVFFPGLFLLSKRCLRSIPGLRWNEGDAVIVSARLVSSIQAIMASTAGYIISTSCEDIIEDQHWLTSSYILFAVPYFVYDIYAMFLCYWHKLQVKGHEVDNGSKSKALAVAGYLRREFLMVLHHVVMVTMCFPISVFWRQGKGDYFQGVMFLAELSTPSVCLGKILIQLMALKREVCYDWPVHQCVVIGGILQACEGNVTPLTIFGTTGSSSIVLTVLMQLFLFLFIVPCYKYKQQHRLLHKVNGAVMLITFFLCRVLLFPYLYYVYGRHASIPFFRVPFTVPWQCNLGAALLMAPQLYWFSLIFRGAFRLFTGKSSRSRKPIAPVKPDSEGHAVFQSANGYNAQMVGRETPTMSH